MTLEMLVGLAVTFISAIVGAASYGNLRATRKAAAKAEQQRTEEHAAATEAVAERRVEVTKEASNVQQTVNHMPDDDVDRELRKDWTRPGSR